MAKKHLLIIEDEPTLVKALKEKLSTVGLEVEVAYDGREALKKIKQNPPDLIVLDILLPEMNGLEVLDKIRGNNKYNDIPVIVLSNYSAEDVMEEALESGVEEYLVKANTSLEDIKKKVKEKVK